MYRVQGADQKEYGPISAEQVHQWIQENRLNRFSLAERDGDPGWKPLEQFPEFAGALGPTPSGLGPTVTGGLPARDAVLVPDPQAAGRTLKAPAITLIFFAIAGMVFAVSGLFLKGFFMGTWIQLLEQMNLPLADNARAELQAAATAGIGIFDVVQVLVGIGLNVVMLIGALKMMKLESWGLAFAAAILVMLPCGSCCCCLGIPLGVWLIVLLNKPEIKTAFR